MKKAAGLFLIMVALLLAVSADARPARRSSMRTEAAGSGRDHAVYANVAGLVWGWPGVGYQQALSSDNSVGGDLFFRYWGAGDYSINYLGVDAYFNWFLGDHGRMSGWFA